MPDKQIHPTGDVSAPADYVLSSSAELLLKMAFARFDGTGAAGAFKPCLRIISDAGTVAGEAVADDTVAAGGSADVTWFPRVGAAAAVAAAGAAVFARAWNDSFSGDPAQSVNAGATTNASFANAETTNASVVSFTTQVHTNDTAILLAAGTYLMYCGTHWDAATPSLTCLIDQSGTVPNAFPHLPIFPGTNPNVGDGIGTATSQDFAVCHVTTGAPSERILLGNQLGVAHFAQQCFFVIVYIPTA